MRLVESVLSGPKRAFDDHAVDRAADRALLEHFIGASQFKLRQLQIDLGRAKLAFGNLGGGFRFVRRRERDVIVSP